LREILIDGKQAMEMARAAGQTALNPKQLADIMARYDQWGAVGISGLPCGISMISAWRSTTNWPLRLVRPVKVKLKVAGGFLAIGGSEAFCIIRSVRETSKCQGTHPFQALRAAFAGGE
jgi:transposase